MGRFNINDGKIFDNETHIMIDVNDVDNLQEFLNRLEMDKLEYKRELNTLKHKIKKLVE